MNTDSQTIELTVPNFGESEKIELVEWFKHPGDTFKEGDELADLVIDKAAFTLEAPQSGKIIEIFAANNSEVCQGQKLALIQIGRYPK